ncbi:MAG TPA: helix-turn-helix transcriptional regulator [Burkholderiales bacterium]|nr:helix-turn-helix transcriptional regulator [Burkholderiales bacterium]
MKKGGAAGILAANLKRLMAGDPQLKSQRKLAEKCDVSQKGISNVLAERSDPQVSTIEKIAAAFKLEPYQLLLPSVDQSLLPIIQAYNLGDVARELLEIAAETARRRAVHKDAAGTRRATDDRGESAVTSVPTLHTRAKKWDVSLDNK